MAFVDRVAHRLADEMVGDGVHGEFVPFEQIAFGGAVAAVFQGLGHVEVVTPAGQLQAGVAKLAGLAGQILKRHIGPLAGEERDGAGHGMFLSSGGQNREQKRRGFCQNSCVLQPAGIGWDQGRLFRRRIAIRARPLCAPTGGSAVRSTPTARRELAKRACLSQRMRAMSGRWRSQRRRRFRPVAESSAFSARSSSGTSTVTARTRSLPSTSSRGPARWRRPRPQRARSGRLPITRTPCGTSSPGPARRWGRSSIQEPPAGPSPGAFSAGDRVGYHQ